MENFLKEIIKGHFSNCIIEYNIGLEGVSTKGDIFNKLREIN